MESNTTQKLSYLPLGDAKPSVSYAPRGFYALPVAKMDGNTTYTLRYAIILFYKENKYLS